MSLNTTPFRSKLNGSLHFIGVIPDHETLKNDLAEDMIGSWVGFMPVDTFLSDFGFAPGDGPLVPRGCRFPKPRKNAKESKLYKPFFSVVKKHNLCPDIKVYITANRSNDRNGPRPDGAAQDYPKSHSLSIPPSAPHQPTMNNRDIPIRQAAVKQPATNPPAADVVSPKESPVDWHRHGIIFEFKPRDNNDPFHTPEAMVRLNSKMLQKSDKKSMGTLGQLTAYAREAFSYQHRTHLFQLLIFGSFVRFLRWDRAGTIVSESFNYVQNPAPLAHFFKGYSNMTDVQRGWDMSIISPLSKLDLGLFQQAVTTFVQNMNNPTHPQRVLPGAERTLDEEFPPYQLTVSPGHIGETMTLIIQAPVDKLSSPCGRTTRGYLAYSIEKKRLVFLKDSWRVSLDILQPEDLSYAALRDANVPHLPTILSAGDVKDANGTLQTSLNQQYARDEKYKRWRHDCSKLRDHIHTRIVQEIAYPTTAATRFFQVVRALSHALEAMEVAERDAKLLHRDLSPDNVMLNADGTEGILNDWDHAGKTTLQEKHQLFRTGTWQFMSIALLSDPHRARHTILDDLESIYWNLCYKSNHHARRVQEIDSKVFDEHETARLGGELYTVGGAKKDRFLQKGQYASLGFKCKALDDLIVELGDKWREFYRAKDDVSRNARYAAVFEELRAKYSKPSFWREIFNRYIDEGAWEDDELVPDQCPQVTQGEDSKRRAHMRLITIVRTEATEVVVQDLGTVNEGDADEEDEDSGTDNDRGEKTGGDNDREESDSDNVSESAGASGTDSEEDDNPLRAGIVPAGSLFSATPRGSHVSIPKRSITECLDGDDEQTQGSPKQKKMKALDSDSTGLVGPLSPVTDFADSSPVRAGNAGLTFERDLKSLPARARNISVEDPQASSDADPGSPLANRQTKLRSASKASRV